MIQTTCPAGHAKYPLSLAAAAIEPLAACAVEVTPTIVSNSGTAAIITRSGQAFVVARMRIRNPLSSVIRERSGPQLAERQPLNSGEACLDDKHPSNSCSLHRTQGGRSSAIRHRGPPCDGG
ncbi:hypothetical protein GCM10020369_36630 [Cryptosporangium minutisporangium]|uniref:Uncharacterized protein n=1 Tax=Cryptosporangium minutisporangium TaxID=113569 RepID=A0ABP6T090_9ACTN